MHVMLNYNMPALFRCILSYSFPYRKHIVLIVHCQSASALQTGQLRMFQTEALAYLSSTVRTWYYYLLLFFHYLPSCPQDRYIMFPLFFSRVIPLPHHMALSTSRSNTFCYTGSGTNTSPDPSSFVYWIPSFSDSMASFRSIFLFILMASLFLNPLACYSV